MAEVAIAAASAAVYYFDTETTQWVPVDGGLSVVYIYQNSETNSFRVIGMSQVEENKVVINSQLFKELQYARASETFHNWADSMHMYGLNFSSLEDAVNFESVVAACVAKLTEIAALEQPPVAEEEAQPPPPQPTPPAEPTPPEQPPPPPAEPRAQPAPPAEPRAQPAPPSEPRAQPTPPGQPAPPATPPGEPSPPAEPPRSKPVQPAHANVGRKAASRPGVGRGSPVPVAAGGGAAGGPPKVKAAGGVANKFEQMRKENEEKAKAEKMAEAEKRKPGDLEALQEELKKIFREELELAKKEIVKTVRAELYRKHGIELPADEE